MPPSPHPLPAQLGGVFPYADARAAGVSRARLRSRDLESPFRGVRRIVGEDPTADGGPLALDRMLRLRVLREARAYATVMAPHAFFAGRTAAVLHGLPVADPVSCWAMLGAELAERELIRLGDAIVRVPRGPGGRRHPELQLATVDELRAAALEPHRPGRVRLLRALAQIRVGSMSPLETDTRLEVVGAGLPEPELDVEIRAASSGRLLGIADQRFPEYRVLVEVEGDHHRTDRAQWSRDIEKLAAYAGEGYDTVRVTSAHVRTRPARGVALIRAALIRGGWLPRA